MTSVSYRPEVIIQGWQVSHRIQKLNHENIQQI